MNVSSALRFPTATPTLTPTATRTETATETADTKVARSPQSSAEFAAFLSMIVGNDPKLRSELAKQLPEDSASLLDHLLASTDETQSTLSGAVDAARYGMIPDRSGVPQSASTSIDNTGVNGAAAPSPIPQSVLARVTARKSPSLEELLAVGDHAAASVRVGIDNVLAKSGTTEGLELAANHAANVALSAALAASANDTATPIKDLEALDPELRGRLERVIERMKTEYGHDVTVVETARSQERQDVLYAQGRTAPGNIVTNTLDSKHTQGEAVDVIIDGTWANAKGFARLQEVAKEEGLKTLGMSDPGHLELPKDSWTTNTDVRVMNASSNAAAPSGIARVATVARVASVGVGMSVGPTQAEIPAIPQPTVQTNGAAGLLPQRESNAGTNSQSPSDSTGDQSSRKSALKSSDNGDTRATGHAYQETPSDIKSKFIGPVDEAQRPSGAAASDAVDRVHDINAMREQQAAKPLSQITLEVDGGDGTTSQVKVDVRGNVVGTHISTDSASAERLRNHVNELKTGLESRGLESDSVRISTQGSRVTDTGDGAKHGAGIERDALRMTGAGTSSGAANSDQSAQQGARDKSSAARDWDGKQAARDEQRAQNRDAQGRGSGNQDRQRPQYQEKQ